MKQPTASNRRREERQLNARFLAERPETFHVTLFIGDELVEGEVPAKSQEQASSLLLCAEARRRRVPYSRLALTTMALSTAD
jgi:hypothetical protein